MLDFVDWLTNRTNNGVVRWEVKSNVIATKLLGLLLAEFVILAMPEGHVWKEFTIRDEEGEASVSRGSAAGCGKRVAACAGDGAFVYGGDGTDGEDDALGMTNTFGGQKPALPRA